MDRGKEKGVSAVVAGGRRTLYRGPGREQLNTMGSAGWTASVAASASAVLDGLWSTGNLARGSEAEITRWHRPWRGVVFLLTGRGGVLIYPRGLSFLHPNCQIHGACQLRVYSRKKGKNRISLAVDISIYGA